MPTNTTNRLHFGDLENRRFEDLGLNIVSRLHEWKEIYHYGRSRNDGGIDIHAILSQDDEDQHWMIQCKRYAKFAKNEADEVIKDLNARYAKPYKLLVIVACDISRETVDYFKHQCAKASIPAGEIWPASVLEAKLYKEHKDLLLVYFGVKLENKFASNATRIRYANKMKKRLEKELYIASPYRSSLIHTPYNKFSNSSAIVRSVDDETYPYIKDGSEWFKENFYNIVHNGLEMWLGAAGGHYILMDKTGRWELTKDYFEKRKNDSQYAWAKIMIIGRIPFEDIVDCVPNGDEYGSDPHIFCHFKYEDGPFKQVTHRIIPGQGMDMPFWKLEPDKRTYFPKCNHDNDARQ